MKTQIRTQIRRVLVMLGFGQFVQLAEYNRLNKLGVRVIW